jgi:HEAT repeat protein
MSRAILQVFEDYQKSRLAFVNTVAELAIRPQNIDALYSGGAINLLKTLLLDPVPAIQQSAALAIGRLANHSEDIAESVIQNDIISHLIYSLSSQNRFFKKASCYVLRAISKHSAQLAEDIVNCGAIEPLANCLEDFDVTVKESAAWVLGYIAKHNERLAFQVKESKSTLEALIMCLKESEVSLKRCVTQTLSSIAYHSEELAMAISEKGLEIIVKVLNDPDMFLKRNVCQLIGNISKHSVVLSHLILNALGKPAKLLYCLKDPDLAVRKNAAFAILEIVNKSPDNSKVFIDLGGVCAIVDYISSSEGDFKLYGILALGYLASHQEHFAKSMFDYQKTLPLLRDILLNESNQQVKAAVCYTIGNLGKHSTQHSNLVSSHNFLPLLLMNYQIRDANDNLKQKSKRALKQIISCCHNISAMEPLIQAAPKKMILKILNQFVLCLKSSGTERKQFLQRGILQRLLALKKGIRDVIKQTDENNTNDKKENELNYDEEIIKVIDEGICPLFPEEIVKYYNIEEIHKKIEELKNEETEQ